MRGRNDMDYKKARKILNIGLLIALFAILLGVGISILLSEAAGLIIMWIGVGIALVVISIGKKHYKCPFCDGRLSPRDNIPNFCPHCGNKLK